uniref:Uncharacterized protein n=1 Tax=Romanomermis culicivorax TaxID=13658 RepID=A0A915JVB4_ROMCU
MIDRYSAIEATYCEMLQRPCSSKRKIDNKNSKAPGVEHIAFLSFSNPKSDKFHKAASELRTADKFDWERIALRIKERAAPLLRKANRQVSSALKQILPENLRGNKNFQEISEIYELGLQNVNFTAFNLSTSQSTYSFNTSKNLG